MHIPPSHVAAGPATPTIPYSSLTWLSPEKEGSGGGGAGVYPENWSSLIGIVTAIIGNVLISFALNMQRYAHIRLDREWQDKERQRKKRNVSSLSLSRLAEEVTKMDSSRRNGMHGRGDMVEHRGADGDGLFEASESDPLIPRSNLRPEVRRGDSGGEGLEEETYKQQSYLKSPYWWLGIILMTVGEAGNFLAYGFAPASIVSPLGVVALISNCIIAPFMLKEPFRKRDALGVIIAVGGAVTVVLSANDNNPKLGPGEIWDLIRRWEFETYLGITCGVIALLMVASNRYGEKSVLIDLGLVGLFGGYTALSTKGVASLLSYTLWRAITFPVFYLLVAILVGTAVMQIKYVNRALQRFDATQVIPVQFVLFTLSVIGGSAVLYRDFERTSGEDAGKFVGGCALTFFGVWLITSGRPSQHDDDDEDREPEREDAINLVGERYTDEVDRVSDEYAGSTRPPSTTRALSPPLNLHSRYRDDTTSRPTTPTINLPPTTPTTPTRPASANLLSSLVTNPWAQPSSPSHRTPPLNRHTSTPVLPSEAATPPLPSSTFDPYLAAHQPPHTPTRHKSTNEVLTTTNTPASTHLRRLRTTGGARNGPLLASPLSTSLSTMVQDLKRGGSVRSTRDAGGDARRRSVLGAGDEEGLGEGVLCRRHTRDGGFVDGGEVGWEVGDGGGMGRGRSLSATLGELWRGIRGRGSLEGLNGGGQLGEGER
ncbi:DUF803-domain-containing protein [Decorospora gaudefroyi]|uniref:DUF803-domain-containing protein n=1 Tax=Decorospora gaudefroyi TaxID=184978 RepID=A0A6A5K8T3_9PLEO|nr:DUF803-domain-containing protein [Decorospora gaudefroyi]